MYAPSSVRLVWSPRQLHEQEKEEEEEEKEEEMRKAECATGWLLEERPAGPQSQGCCELLILCSTLSSHWMSPFATMYASRSEK